MHWFHGNNSSTLCYHKQGGRSDHPDMLFFSASVNVARRYGETIHQITTATEHLPTITLSQWFDEQFPEGSFVIQGDQGYDFPVDTLVIRQTSDLGPVQCLTAPVITQKDDGLATQHTPQHIDDRQFELYLSEMFGPHYPTRAECLAAWRSELE